jgi:tRNA A37 threonylcarbamoyladenosine synthetase subunit TsaC/SUA5/YrdC
LIDAGPTPGGAASTIVGFTAGDAALVRAGAISWDEIQACLHNVHTTPPSGPA